MLDTLLTHGWPILVLAAWFGLAVGSFLNVVIHRIPLMLWRDWVNEARMILGDEQIVRAAASITEAGTAAPTPAAAQDEPTAEDNGSAPLRFNLLVPRSRCPSCGASISALQNIPVVSWLVLRGRCAGCANPILVRYPAVELLTAVATLYVLALFGYTWLGLAVLYLTWSLIALTFIDFDTQLLPDQMTLPLLWLGLIVNVGDNGLVSLTDAVAGAVAGYLMLWSVYWIFKLVTGKEGMGHGDFKLLAAAGAWAGWQVLPGVVLIASVAGLAYALTTSVLGKRKNGAAIAFGPFLAIGAWVAILQRDMLLNLYL